MDRDADDLVYRTLLDIFGIVNGQLQFAEAKNGALIAANVAVVVGVGALVASEAVNIEAVRQWLIWTCAGLVGAALVGVYSLLPVFGDERHELGKFQKGAGGENLVFFGDIAGTNPSLYLAALFEALGLPAAEQAGRLHENLADQIVINAGIAKRKFRFFRWAAVLTTISATVPLVVLGFVWVGSGFKLL